MAGRFIERARNAVQNVRENIQERREDRRERREHGRDNQLCERSLPEGPRARNLHQTNPVSQTPAQTPALKAENVRLDAEGRVVATIPLTPEQARLNLICSYQGHNFSTGPHVAQPQQGLPIRIPDRYTIERSNQGGQSYLTVTLDQSIDSLNLRIQNQNISLNQVELRNVVATREAAEQKAREQAAKEAQEEATRQRELQKQAELAQERARQEQERAQAVGRVQGALNVLLGQREITMRVDNNGQELSDPSNKIAVKCESTDRALKDAARINSLMREAGISGPEVLVVGNELIFDADQIANYGVDRFIREFSTISARAQQVLNEPSIAARPAPEQVPTPEPAAHAAPASPSPETPSDVPTAPASPATSPTPEANPTAPQAQSGDDTTLASPATSPTPEVIPAPSNTPSGGNTPPSETYNSTASPELTPSPSPEPTPTAEPETTSTATPDLSPPPSTTPSIPPEPTEEQRRTEIKTRIEELTLDHLQQSALFSMLDTLSVDQLPKAQLQLAQLRAEMIAAHDYLANAESGSIHSEVFRQDLARLAGEVTQNILENKDSSLEGAALRDRNIPLLRALGYGQSNFSGYYERTTETSTGSITRYIHPSLGLLEEREISGSQMVSYGLNSELTRTVTYAASTQGPDGKWTQQPGGFLYKHGGWHDAQSLERYETVIATLNTHLTTWATGIFKIGAEGQEAVATALESLPPGSGEYIAEKYKKITGYDLDVVLSRNLDRSHYERGMRQLYGFDAQRQAHVMNEALNQDYELVGLNSVDVEAILAATADLTPYQAQEVRAEFANIQPHSASLMPRLVEQLPFAARIQVLDNLGLTNTDEIARLIHANQSADDVAELFERLTAERRVEVKQAYDRITNSDLYDRVFVKHFTYSGYNSGGSRTETRTLRADLESLIEPHLSASAAPTNATSVQTEPSATPLASSSTPSETESAGEATPVTTSGGTNSSNSSEAETSVSSTPTSPTTPPAPDASEPELTPATAPFTAPPEAAQEPTPAAAENPVSHEPPHYGPAPTISVNGIPASLYSRRNQTISDEHYQQALQRISDLALEPITTPDGLTKFPSLGRFGSIEGITDGFSHSSFDAITQERLDGIKEAIKLASGYSGAISLIPPQGRTDTGAVLEYEHLVILDQNNKSIGIVKFTTPVSLEFISEFSLNSQTGGSPDATVRDRPSSEVVENDIRAPREALYQEVASRLEGIFGTKVAVSNVRDFNGVPTFVFAAGTSVADSERVTDLLVQARTDAGLSIADIGFIPGVENSFQVGRGDIGIYAGDLFDYTPRGEVVVKAAVLENLERHAQKFKVCFQESGTPPQTLEQAAPLDLNSPEVKELFTNLRTHGIEFASQIPPQYLSDRGFVRESVRLVPELIEHAAPSLQTDQDFLIEVLIEPDAGRFGSRYYHEIISHLSPTLLDNDSFMTRLIDNSMDAYSFASERLRADRNFLQAAIDAKSDIPLASIPLPLRHDRVVLSHLFTNSSVYMDPEESIRSLIPEELLRDKAFCLEAARKNPEIFASLDPVLYSDREFIVSALADKLDIYRHLPESLKEDRHFAEMAYRLSRASVSDLPSSLLQDKAFVATLMSLDGGQFRWLPHSAHPELATDPAIIAAAAKSNAGIISLVPKEVFEQHPNLVATLATQSYSSRTPLEQVLGTLPPTIAEIFSKTEEALKVLGFSELTSQPRANESIGYGQAQFGRFDLTQEVIRNRWRVAPEATKQRLSDLLGEDYFTQEGPRIERPRVAMILPHTDHNGAFEQEDGLIVRRDVVDEIARSHEAIVYEVSSKEEFIRVIEELKASGGVNHLIIGAHGDAQVMSFGGVDPATVSAGSRGDGSGFLTVHDAEVFSRMGGVVRDSGSVVLMSCSTGGATADGRNIAKEFHAALPRTSLYAPTKPTEAPQLIDPMTGLIQAPRFRVGLDEIPSFTATPKAPVEFPVDELSTSAAHAVKHILEGATYPLTFETSTNAESEVVQVSRNGRTPHVLLETNPDGTSTPVQGSELSALAAQMIVGQKALDFVLDRNLNQRQIEAKLASVLGVAAENLELTLGKDQGIAQISFTILYDGQRHRLVTVEVPLDALDDGENLPIATDVRVDLDLLGRCIQPD